MKRYLRNTVLEEIQEEGQLKLQNTTALVVGAGGLGSHLLYHLASIGIGKIIIADFDTVSITNLQRQILFKESDIGENKAKIAEKTLKNYNSEIEYTVINKKIESMDFFDNKDIDIIYDCTDNYDSKLMLSNYGLNKKIPTILASAIEFQGWVLPQRYDLDSDLIFSDIFDKKDSDYKCDDLGVISPTVSFIASIQAMEGFKVILALDHHRSYYLDINCFNYTVNQIVF